MATQIPEDIRAALKGAAPLSSDQCKRIKEIAQKHYPKYVGLVETYCKQYNAAKPDTRRTLTTMLQNYLK